MDEQINRSYLLLRIYFDLCIKEAEEPCFASIQIGATLTHAHRLKTKE